MNIQRIEKDIQQISMFNETPEAGVTRFSYTEEDQKAREYLIREMKALGLTVTVDGAGNIRGKRQGKFTEASTVMTGSHIDTVPNGGKFDGLLGVVLGLEALRTLEEENIQTDHPIELIIFAEEEGVNFGTPMVGSKALTGEITSEDFKNLKNPKGQTLYETLKAFGLDPDAINIQGLKEGEVKAMIEVHVEQSKVLESEGLTLGVVEKIAGVKRYLVEVEGVANHSGATPMNLRQDALSGAAKMIASLDELTRIYGFPTTVATVGRILCEPNAINVIPGKVSFTLDIRDVQSKGIDLVFQQFKQIFEEVLDIYDLMGNITQTGEAPVIELSSLVRDALRKNAEELHIPHRTMNSGATHDACILRSHTEVGMLFVPSIEGRSHVPQEKTSYEDIEMAGEVLYRTLLDLAVSEKKGKIPRADTIKFY